MSLALDELVRAVTDAAGLIDMAIEAGGADPRAAWAVRVQLGFLVELAARARTADLDAVGEMRAAVQRHVEALMDVLDDIADGLAAAAGDAADCVSIAEEMVDTSSVGLALMFSRLAARARSTEA